MLKFYLVGVGVTLSRRRRHTRFAYVSIPVDDPLLSRGEHCSPAKRTLKEKYHKVTFSLSYFSVTKSTKSQQGGLTPSSFRTTGGVHELVARAMRGKCVRYGAERKSIAFTAPRGFNHTTRANTSHEKAEQIRARIVCTPLKKEGRAWVEFAR